MPPITIHTALSDAVRAGILALDERSDAGDRLSDHLIAAVRSGTHTDCITATVGDVSSPSVCAQTARSGDTLLLEVIGERDADLCQQLVGTLLAAAEWDGPIRWWIHGRADADRPAALRLGFDHERTLLEMERDLHDLIDSDLPVRAFVPDTDTDAWIELNNAAFSTHGEQSDWDTATLQARLGEPWFDADGFLIHETDAEMDGFCWTKIHPDSIPLTGEIYVIGVDPSQRGRGLGRLLTIAGLASMQRAGAQRAILFVDEPNEAALSIYRSLDFEVTATHEAMLRPGPGDGS